MIEEIRGLVPRLKHISEKLQTFRKKMRLNRDLEHFHVSMKHGNALVIDDNPRRVSNKIFDAAMRERLMPYRPLVVERSRVNTIGV